MQKIKELKPLYYDQFQCIGGACEDTCCAGWGITIDKKSYQKYRNEKHPDLKPLFKENIQRNRKSQNEYDYAKFKLDDNGACGMLSNDGLCTIHTATGAESLCQTCQIFPRNITILNNTSEKSLDVSCPEAARLILLNEDGIDFVEDYTDNTKLHLSKINHQNQQTEEFFWSNRMFFISALQHRKHSIEIRLMIIGLYIKKMEPLSPNERFQQSEIISQRYLKILDDNETATLFNTFEIQYDLHFKLSHTFLKDYAVSNKRLQDLMDISAYRDLSQEDGLNEFIEIITNLKEDYTNNKLLQISLENYLVNLTFSKYNESTIDFIEFYSFLSIQYALIRLFILGLINKLPFSPENIVRIFQSFEKTCTHNSNYINSSKEVVSNTNFSKAAQAVNIIHM